LFIFNGLTAFSFRAISHMPVLDPKGPIDILVCAREAASSALCETPIPACAGIAKFLTLSEFAALHANWILFASA
jgi:hypothetical protein